MRLHLVGYFGMGGSASALAEALAYLFIPVGANLLIDVVEIWFQAAPGPEPPGPVSKRMTLRSARSTSIPAHAVENLGVAPSDASTPRAQCISSATNASRFRFSRSSSASSGR